MKPISREELACVICANGDMAGIECGGLNDSDGFKDCEYLPLDLADRVLARYDLKAKEEGKVLPDPKLYHRTRKYGVPHD